MGGERGTGGEMIWRCRGSGRGREEGGKGRRSCRRGGGGVELQGGREEGPGLKRGRKSEEGRGYFLGGGASDITHTNLD